MNWLTIIEQPPAMPVVMQPAGTRPDPLVEDYRHLVAAHFADARLQTSAICERLAVSRKQLELKIKRHLDCSPKGYLANYRLEKSRQMIAGGEMIKVVSWCCGFSSHAYFSKKFREKYGLTPSDFALCLKLKN